MQFFEEYTSIQSIQNVCPHADNVAGRLNIWRNMKINWLAKNPIIEQQNKIHRRRCPSHCLVRQRNEYLRFFVRPQTNAHSGVGRRSIQCVHRTLLQRGHVNRLANLRMDCFIWFVALLFSINIPASRRTSSIDVGSIMMLALEPFGVSRQMDGCRWIRGFKELILLCCR